MNVIYDHFIFNRQQFGGISRYYTELIRHLSIPYQLSVHIHSNYYLHEYVKEKNGLYIPFRLEKIFKKNIKQLNTAYLRRLVKKANPTDTVYHTTVHTIVFDKVTSPLPMVVTVHDLTPERYPDLSVSSARVIKDKYEVMKYATRIIAITQKTKEDIIAEYDIDEGKIDVVYHGVSMVEPQNEGRIMPKQFLLFVGLRRGYKNFDRLLEAFALLRQDFPDLHLFAAGATLSEDERRRVNELGLKDYVRGERVSDAFLSYLYSQASLFVFPSLYEGFGLPILEAFSMHCPIAISKASCFPEIAGNAAAYFDPLSVDDMTKVIRQVLHNSQYRDALIDAGDQRINDFSWEQTTRQTEEVYRKAIREYNDPSDK